MSGKTVQRMQGPAKTPGTARMGIHKDSYALFTPNAGRKVPRRNKVTVTVDKAAVAAAFATRRDSNAPHGYNPVILPQSHTITR